jgi:hypothetical protein
MRITIVAISLAGMLTSSQQMLRAVEKARLADLPPPVPPVAAQAARVDFFRELLGMTPEQREAALGSRDERQKRVIYSRLQEFEQLSPEEREVRLQRMKLRAQLVPLLHVAPSERGALLGDLPEADRAPLQDRLEKWDQLAPELQKSVLENEAMLNCVMPGHTVSSNQLQRILASLPPTMTNRLARDLERWNGMPPENREVMYHEFRGLFDLDASEQAKVFNALSNEERAQMEKTLEAFRQLPKPQRDQCIVAFEQFANMSLAERAQFIRNAQSWQELPPAERQKWRRLVTQFPPLPPRPPGVNTVPPPPLPPAKNPVSKAVITTAR